MKGKHRVLRVTGGRVAVHNTSRIPDRELDSAIRELARHVDLHRVVVHLKRLGDRAGSYGRAYPYIPSITNLNGLRRGEWLYLITVKDGHYLSTLAHEAKHVEQFRRGQRGSERPAQAFGHWFEDLYLESRTAP